MISWLVSPTATGGGVAFGPCQSLGGRGRPSAASARTVARAEAPEFQDLSIATRFICERQGLRINPEILNLTLHFQKRKLISYVVCVMVYERK